MTPEPPRRWWVTGADDEMLSRDLVSEPLVGWRAWHVVEEDGLPTLVSWWLSTAWPAQRRLEAACERHGSQPDLGHDCGIHAFKSREDALVYVGRKVPYVGFPFVRAVEGRVGVAIGRVSLWGRVAAHKNGWRAQYAYPYDLFLLDGDARIARDLTRRYAVEAFAEPDWLAA